MIFWGKYDLLPVDQTGDGGDSAVRAGIFNMCSAASEEAPNITKYLATSGDAVRHPTQVPWNNPRNFSRDQLIVLAAGFVARGYRPPVFFYRAMKRLFFAQNFERDYPGTTKYPWPHKVDGKWRIFDFADPLFPNHIGALILAGKIKWALPFLLIAYPAHLISLGLHSLGNHFEENQMIAECYLYGTLKLYVKWHPKWESVSFFYWARRSEIEYHDMLVEFIKGQTNG